jgi:PAS domain S-box-containing protein
LLEQARMTVNETFQRHALHERLAPLAFAAAPAWLWTIDGARLVWTNAAGAAVLGADTPAGLIGQLAERVSPAAREVARLAGSLPASGAVHLARVRGLVSGLSRPLTCSVLRFTLEGGAAGVLITAAEPVKPVLSLAERVRRSFFERPEVAVFASDGVLLHAGSQAAFARHSLSAMGAAELARNAMASGRATGPVQGGALTLTKLGGGDAVVLMATLQTSHAEAGARLQPAAQVPVQPTEDQGVEGVTGAGDGDAVPTVSMVVASEIVANSGGVSANAPAPTAETGVGAEQITPAAHPDPSGSQAVAPEPAASPRDKALAVLAEAEERLVARRHPLRFVWTIDAAGRFMIEAGEFTALAGRPTTDMLGRTWDEAARALALDTEGRVSRAIVSHDTWSGVTVAWPAEDTDERLPVLLSGLPVLNRDRSFSGYRGFGVCREVNRIAAVIAARRAFIEAQEAATVVDNQAGEEPPSVRETSSPDQSAPGQRVFDRPRVEPPVFEPSPPREGRTPLTVVPAAKNVVPLRAGGPPERRPALSTVERTAFQEIARALGARIEGDAAPLSDAEAPTEEAGVESATPTPAPPARPGIESGAAPVAPDLAELLRPPAEIPVAVPLERAALDRLPAAVMLFRGGAVLFGNRALLEWTGHETLDALVAAGGLEALFDYPGPIVRREEDGDARALMLRSRGGEAIPVDARLSAIAENGASAMMMVLTRAVSDVPLRDAMRAREAAETIAGELKSILDTATDGVLVVDGEGRVQSANRSAEALFGYDAAHLEGRSFLDLFAPESQRDAADYLEGLTRSGVASLLNDGREVIGRVQQGGLIPLFMTMGRIGDAPAKFCAVFRDLTQWKRAEEDLITAKRQAEKASSAKSDFLAKISHEIRTPLNAIIGFSEVMMEERLGPIGNERYRGYAKDIHASGEHMISLLNDLLDLSKIEAGKLDLIFTKVDLNDVMQQCVAIMQPQANRERIIIRTALAAALPPVVADARSVRQIILNLLSNSIKFTGAGGQVIVSTALTDDGEAVMRVRDTGIGMSEQDIETALEPFRQLPASAKLNTVGTGLGLPLTKALAEANRASFRIKSAVNAGTLVEILFPSTRVLSE